MNPLPRRLLLLRHAKSAWDSDAATDFDRPLAKRGRKDAPRIGHWLREQGLVPDLVVSSPAQRARETTLHACKAMGVKEARIRWEPRVYAADPATLLAVLGDYTESPASIMLVGHNPGLELLLEHLCANLPDTEDGKLLPTAAVAVLDMPQQWRELEAGSATLHSLTRPRNLSED